MSTADLLRKFWFLAPFSPSQLERIVELAPRVHFGPGEAVFCSGDPSGAMYLILEGKVKIHRQDEEGSEVVLNRLEPGQVFGELALLSSEPRMATVTTLTACEFLMIDRSMLIETVAGAPPEAILKLFAVLSNQIRAVNEREFRELLSQRTLAAEMEAERQKALTQMVAGVAHELNTPLGIINTAASIIEREMGKPAIQALRAQDDTRYLVEDVQEALDLIKGNIQRAHRLVQDFKKVSVSQLSDVKEPMDLSEAVQETVNLAKAHLRRSGLIINVNDTLPAAHKTWVGYRGYLSQVLLNLLTNIEHYAYAPGSGGVADITLALKKPDKFAITVRDYGKGMSEEVRTHIFEPFYTTGRATGGTGLGMAIVHNLVTTALKGAIRINSAPQQGTEVIVTFPRSIPD